jgi:hypothetical protein
MKAREPFGRMDPTRRMQGSEVRSARFAATDRRTTQTGNVVRRKCGGPSRHGHS